MKIGVPVKMNKFIDRLFFQNKKCLLNKKDEKRNKS